MDTSPEYIKQCEKATDIQKLRDAKRIGDFFFSQLDVERCCFVNYPCPEQPSHTEAECYVPEVVAWLPRQDQLQEMVGGYPEHWVGFVNWTEVDYPVRVYPLQQKQPKPFWHFASMEQLWLAFVMDGLYQKRWNGEDWVVR